MAGISTKENIEFLLGAKEALNQLESRKALLANQEIEEKRLEKALASQRKAVKDSIDITVKKRLDEITQTYDKEIAKGQEKLRKVRANRDKAKAKGIKERIAEETADLYEEIRQLKTATKTMYKKDRVPMICNTSAYYVLFMPRTVRELLTLLFVMGVLIGLVPYGVYSLIPAHKVWHLVLCYVLGVLIFGGAYVLFSNATKGEYMTSLKEGRKNWSMIKALNKKIRAVQNSIHRDKNEDAYNLEHFDTEIDEILEEIDGVSTRKQEALYIFENETKHTIASEIRKTNQASLEDVSDKLSKVRENIKTIQADVKTRVINMTDEYDALLGKEFMSAEKLDGLIRIFETDEPESLTEAQMIYKQKQVR